MPEVKLEERIYRVIGYEGRGHYRARRVWRYSSRPDALWRARGLSRSGDLIEFSYSDIVWKPAPSAWLDNDEL